MMRYEEILRDLYRTGKVSVNELIAITAALELITDYPELVNLESFGTCGQEGVLSLIENV